eukprot:3479334-Amphidinium_carterae.1
MRRLQALEASLSEREGPFFCGRDPTLVEAPACPLLRAELWTLCCALFLVVNLVLAATDTTIVDEGCWDQSFNVAGLEAAFVGFLTRCAHNYLYFKHLDSSRRRLISSSVTTQTDTTAASGTLGIEMLQACAEDIRHHGEFPRIATWFEVTVTIAVEIS